jgi:hypothetical protein
MGRGEKRLQDFGWEARREESTERPRHGWNVNIKMNLRETGCELDSTGSG